MTIQETIDFAKRGKLKNSNIVNNDAAILDTINLGLVELYKRFPLKVDEAVITMRNGKTEYKLDGTDPDVSMPVGSHFMWIVAAYQEVEDPYEVTYTPITVQIAVNEEENPLSVQTVAWDTVQFPVVSEGAYASIIYVAAPDMFTAADFNDTLPLPPQMLEPLMEYMCYQANSTLDAEIDTDKYYQRFEASCSRIELRGMTTSDDLDMSDRHMKGFV